MRTQQFLVEELYLRAHIQARKYHAWNRKVKMGCFLHDKYSHWCKWDLVQCQGRQQECKWFHSQSFLHNICLRFGLGNLNQKLLSSSLRLIIVIRGGEPTHRLGNPRPKLYFCHFWRLILENSTIFKTLNCLKPTFGFKKNIFYRSLPFLTAVEPF